MMLIFTLMLMMPIIAAFRFSPAFAIAYDARDMRYARYAMPMPYALARRGHVIDILCC